jgi:hypothetical protein
MSTCGLDKKNSNSIEQITTLKSDISKIIEVKNKIYNKLLDTVEKESAKKKAKLKQHGGYNMEISGQIKILGTYQLLEKNTAEKVIHNLELLKYGGHMTLEQAKTYSFEKIRKYAQ